MFADTTALRQLACFGTMEGGSFTVNEPFHDIDRRLVILFMSDSELVLFAEPPLRRGTPRPIVYHISKGEAEVLVHAHSMVEPSDARTAGYATADYLSWGDTQYGGRLVSVGSDAIEFDFDCSGSPEFVPLEKGLEIVIGENCSSDYVPFYIGGSSDFCGVIRGRRFSQLFLVQLFDANPDDGIEEHHIVDQVIFDGSQFVSIEGPSLSDEGRYSVSHPEVLSITVLGPDFCE